MKSLRRSGEKREKKRERPRRKEKESLEKEGEE